MAGRRRCRTNNFGGGCCGGFVGLCRKFEISAMGVSGTVCLGGTGGTCQIDSPTRGLLGVSVTLRQTQIQFATPGRPGVGPTFGCCHPTFPGSGVYCNVSGPRGDNNTGADGCECWFDVARGFSDLATTGCINGAMFNYVVVQVVAINSQAQICGGPLYCGGPGAQAPCGIQWFRNGTPPHGAGRGIAAGDVFAPISLFVLPSLQSSQIPAENKYDRTPCGGGIVQYIGNVPANENPACALTAT